MTQKPPYLKKVTYTHHADKDVYPWTIPVFSRDFEWCFTKAVTVVVGENGSGKSSLLETIAANCGFGAYGGSQNQKHRGQSDVAPILEAMRFSWLPRTRSGFFFRAESFFEFSAYIDELTQDDAKALRSYGGKSLNKQSHGEAFLSLFNNRFGSKGIYIFDEPEAALSPTRQLAFLEILHKLSNDQLCQIILATHSPILMSYSQAELMFIDAEGYLSERSFRATPHWQLLARFMENPSKYQPDCDD